MRRYELQRYGTWAWLDYEAPLVSSDGPEWCLSAYGQMRANVPSPAAAMMTAEDGRPVFEEGGTLVHVDFGGTADRRRWTGIVSEASLTKKGWELTIIEWAGYFSWVPFEGLIRSVNEDPAALFAQLIDDVQARSGSWLGCSVVGTTPVRLGTDLDKLVAERRAVVDERKKTVDSFSKTAAKETKATQDLATTLADEVATFRRLVTEAQTQVAALITAGSPAGQVDAARRLVVDRQADYQQALDGYNFELDGAKRAVAAAKHTKEEAQTSYDAAKKLLDEARQRVKNEGGAYMIDGQDLPGAYRKIQELAEQCGFEWTTETTYSEGEPDLRFVVQYPTAGRRRDDLIFETGVNITSALELDSAGDYANAAVGVGAGEGPSAIRAGMAVKSPRLRRVVTVVDKGITSSAVLAARLRTQLATHSGGMFPSEITVRNHPNCPIGSWSVGDIITVRGTTSLGTAWSGLCRIESWSWPTETEAKLRLSNV